MKIPNTNSSLTNISIVLVVLILIWLDTCLYYQIQYIGENIDNISITEINEIPNHVDHHKKIRLSPRHKMEELAPLEYYLMYNNSDSLKLHIINKFSFAFRGMSVKLMMTDPVDNYLLAPLSAYITGRLDFKNNLPHITANMISYAGVVCAVIAGVLVSFDSSKMHKLSYIMFQLRTWLDDLDGDVARSKMGIHKHVSLQKTSGYIVDGTCDAIGFVAYIIGCYIFMKKVARKPHSDERYSLRYITEVDSTGSNTYLPLEQESEEIIYQKDPALTRRAFCDLKYDEEHEMGSSDDEASSINSEKKIRGKDSSRIVSKVKHLVHKSMEKMKPLNDRTHSKVPQNGYLILCFLLQLGICAALWNRYILLYQDVLESPSTGILKAKTKKTLLKSNITFVIIWFWRLNNGHSLMQMLIAAVVFRKLRSFLNFIKYIGFIEMAILALITELHAIDLRNILIEL